MFAYHKPFSLLVLLSFILAACSATATPTPVIPTLSEPTQTLIPKVSTLAPSSTPPTILAPSPTVTPSPTATPLPTLTPNPILAEARLLGVSWQQPGYKLLLSIQFPEPVKAENVKVVIEEEEIYQCQVLS